MDKKRERFVILAEKRVNNALKQIDLIGNLSNKKNYTYSKDDYMMIIKALEGQLRVTKQKFIDSDKSEKNRFSLGK